MKGQVVREGRRLGRKAPLGVLIRLWCFGKQPFPGLASSQPGLGNWQDLAAGPHVSFYYSGFDKPEAREQTAGQVEGG